MLHIQAWWQRITSLKQNLVDQAFDSCLRTVMKEGRWRDLLIETVAPAPGERILELSGEIVKFTPDLSELHPATHFTLVDWDCMRASSQPLPGKKTDMLRCDDYQITCHGGIFDKVMISWALHFLPDEQKLRLLREMRRILRRGGMLYVVDYDRPENILATAGLAYASRQRGVMALRSHFDGTWIDTIRMADFTDVRRLSSCYERTVYASVVRARRRL